MTTYHVTITGTFDATTDADPANPDTIWHGLTLAAKRSWVQAMQPEPPVEESTPPLTPELLAKVQARYLDVVRGNTGPTWDATRMVYEAIRLNGERSPNTGEYAGNHWEITDELGVVAHDIPEIAAIMPAYDDDPDWHDLFTDQLHTLLDPIASALEADLNARTP